MLTEYKDIIRILKQENAHFAKIFDKHNELDDLIDAAEAGRDHVEPAKLDALKKEKLALKDEAYMAIVKYKKENNLD